LSFSKGEVRRVRIQIR